MPLLLDQSPTRSTSEVASSLAESSPAPAFACGTAAVANGIARTTTWPVSSMPWSGHQIPPCSWLVTWRLGRTERQFSCSTMQRTFSLRSPVPTTYLDLSPPLLSLILMVTSSGLQAQAWTALPTFNSSIARSGYPLTALFSELAQTSVVSRCSVYPRTINQQTSSLAIKTFCLWGRSTLHILALHPVPSSTAPP